MAKTKPKKRNPADATRRNVRASLARDLKLDARVAPPVVPAPDEPDSTPAP